MIRPLVDAPLIPGDDFNLKEKLGPLLPGRYDFLNLYRSGDCDAVAFVRNVSGGKAIGVFYEALMERLFPDL